MEALVAVIRHGSVRPATVSGNDLTLPARELKVPAMSGEITSIRHSPRSHTAARPWRTDRHCQGRPARLACSSQPRIRSSDGAAAAYRGYSVTRRYRTPPPISPDNLGAVRTSPLVTIAGP